MKKRIHYSGGVRCPWAKGFTVRLRGWPVCVSGLQAERIAEAGNQSDDAADVEIISGHGPGSILDFADRPKRASTEANTP